MMLLLSKLHYCTYQRILILFEHISALQVAIINTGGSQERMNMYIKIPNKQTLLLLLLPGEQKCFWGQTLSKQDWITPLRFFQVCSYIRVVFSLVITSTTISCLSSTKELITCINIHQKWSNNHDDTVTAKLSPI